MTISLKKLTAAMALSGCVALSSGTAQAFNNGVAGATSVGDVYVEVTIPSLIIIDSITSNIVMNFATGGVEQNISFCVHGTPATTYEVLFTSGQGTFDLFDGTNSLPYTARYDGDNDATEAGGGNVLAYSTTTASSFPLTPGLGACGTDNASLAIKVTDADVLGLPAGTYSDTVFLTVSPN